MSQLHFSGCYFPRRFLSVAFLGGVLLGYGCGNQKEAANQDSRSRPVLQAKGYVVVPRALKKVYRSSGDLLPNESVNVYAETPGRITDISFREGTQVKKGSLLVQLYDQDVRAQLKKLKVQRALQVTTKGRQEQLLEINGISRQEMDATRTQIAAIDAEIAYQEAQLRKLQIRAPFTGIIGLRQVSEGAIVSTSTLITTLQQIDPLKLDFPVPEHYKHLMKVGDNVFFTVNGIRDTLSGQIKAIQPAADEVTHTITARAIVANPGHRLVPGAFAEVIIPLAVDTTAILIPAQAIIPTTRDKMVAVVRDGRVKTIPVTTGLRLVDNIEITHGLTFGDTVITTGIMQLKDGMPVHITHLSGRRP